MWARRFSSSTARSLIVALATPLLRDFGAGERRDGPAAHCFSRARQYPPLLCALPLLHGLRPATGCRDQCHRFGAHGADSPSRSGLVRSAVDSAVPEIRGGSPVGPLLAASGAFPSDLTQALIVGEETGSLDDELRRMSQEFRDKALSALETLCRLAAEAHLCRRSCCISAWKILGLGQGLLRRSFGRWQNSAISALFGGSYCRT